MTLLIISQLIPKINFKAITKAIRIQKIIKKHKKLLLPFFNFGAHSTHTIPYSFKKG
jgi:hypothetical protein